jgi:hypothetical protein
VAFGPSRRGCHKLPSPCSPGSSWRVRDSASFVIVVLRAVYDSTSSFALLSEGCATMPPLANWRNVGTRHPGGS